MGKLPNGRFGLKAWYPKVKSSRASAEEAVAVEEDSAETPDDGQEAR
jgi:hypothetical protein